MIQMNNLPQLSEDFDPTRRRFVTGVAAGSALVSLGLSPFASARAETQAQMQQQQLGSQELTGNTFHLTLSEQRKNFTGRSRVATTINGSVPGPTLRWREGERVTLKVTNNLPMTSSIHWHGMILPTNMDGVPGLSYDGIKPGATFTYQFNVQQSGTYWYHSHSGYQEQTGSYGSIVIEPKQRDPYQYDRDYVVMLSDWSDENPNRIYAKLKKLSHYYNFNERTTADLFREIQANGVAQTWKTRKMWNKMRMSTRDLSDVTGYTYTYLVNGQTPAEGWKGLFKRGEKIRLRFINGSAMSFFDVRIPGLKMTVVASDGQNIKPISVDEFRIGVAETYDVIVQPSDDSAYTIFAQSIGRSGYARGTLTPDLSLTADVPKMDPVPSLTHADMGMNMSAMGHGGMNHGAMGMSGAKGTESSDMQGMDHSKMNHNMPKQPMQTNMKNMDHSKMNMGDSGMQSMIKHAKTEFGPHVDMRAMDPQYRLSDPGVGLRNNGRRVLTYADIRNLYPTKDRREPSREIELHLTGNMSRYMWSINGVKYADAQPIQLKYGERVRITFVNDTMMNHPMHLHGMWSELETGDKSHLPRKHTVIVQPGSKISYQVTADARGRWAYHCHLLYHMAGMFREVHVA